MESFWIISGLWGLGFVLSLFGARYVLRDESIVSVFAGLFGVIVSLPFYFGIVWLMWGIGDFIVSKLVLLFVVVLSFFGSLILAKKTYLNDEW